MTAADATTLRQLLTRSDNHPDSGTTVSYTHLTLPTILLV